MVKHIICQAYLEPHLHLPTLRAPALPSRALAPRKPKESDIAKRLKELADTERKQVGTCTHVSFAWSPDLWFGCMGFVAWVLLFGLRTFRVLRVHSPVLWWPA